MLMAGPSARVWSALEPNERRLLDRALAGAPLAPTDAYRLVRLPAEALPWLMAAAAASRDAGKGRTVTYSRKVFIPLTNLCRDRCGYCTFAKGPRHPDARTMTPDDVIAVARAGAGAGCKEALFSLGERPEERYAVARAQLARLGYSSTNAYLAAMCDLVLRETGLIPHANPGVMTRDELLALREVCGSLGLMLESTSLRLLQRGQAHYNCPGKVPQTRLETMALAGDLGIPFTTGILIGIGETLEERADALLAIRHLHERYGHIQEVIIQNFRAKPTIRMRAWPEPSLAEMLMTIAVARLILGPEMNVQAPPNLFLQATHFHEDDTGASPGQPSGTDGVTGSPLGPLGLLGAPHDADLARARSGQRPGLESYLAAGINDWGGVSPVTIDHINPERAWPAIGALRRATERAGFTLRERLCVYPEYARRPGSVPDRVRERVDVWADADGLVKEAATVWS